MKRIYEFFKYDQTTDLVITNSKHLSISLDSYLGLGIGISRDCFNLRLLFLFIQIYWGKNI